MLPIATWWKKFGNIKKVLLKMTLGEAKSAPFDHIPVQVKLKAMVL